MREMTAVTVPQRSIPLLQFAQFFCRMISFMMADVIPSDLSQYSIACLGAGLLAVFVVRSVSSKRRTIRRVGDLDYILELPLVRRTLLQVLE